MSSLVVVRQVETISHSRTILPSSSRGGTRHLNSLCLTQKTLSQLQFHNEPTSLSQLLSLAHGRTNALPHRLDHYSALGQQSPAFALSGFNSRSQRFAQSSRD